MARPLRPDPIDGWHHVMNRGVNREPIFLADDDRLMFGQLLADVNERFAVEFHAYCLMGNHFHLLVRCPAGGLSDAMHHLQSRFAHRVNDRSGRVGHLFADRFCSRLISDSAYLANVARYIHRNPLDIEGVSDVAAYRWSSHRTYLGLRPKPRWLHVDTVLAWFDGRRGFDAFVRSAPTDQAELSVDDPCALLRIIDLLIAERCDTPTRHSPAQRRALALEVANTLDDDGHAAILDVLGLADGNATRVAMSRSRRLLIDEPEVAALIPHISALLNPSRAA